METIKKNPMQIRMRATLKDRILDALAKEAYKERVLSLAGEIRKEFISSPLYSEGRRVADEVGNIFRRYTTISITVPSKGEYYSWQFDHGSSPRMSGGREDEVKIRITENEIWINISIDPICLEIPYTRWLIINREKEKQAMKALFTPALASLLEKLEEMSKEAFVFIWDLETVLSSSATAADFVKKVPDAEPVVRAEIEKMERIMLINDDDRAVLEDVFSRRLKKNEKGGGR